jgi:hypothetical protein
MGALNRVVLTGYLIATTFYAGKFSLGDDVRVPQSWKIFVCFESQKISLRSSSQADFFQ